jgi:hypothetical protein
MNTSSASPLDDVLIFGLGALTNGESQPRAGQSVCSQIKESS